MTRAAITTCKSTPSVRAWLSDAAAPQVLEGPIDEIEETIGRLVKGLPGSVKLCDLLTKVLVCEPEEKMTAVDFSSHPYFSMKDPLTFSKLCIDLGEIVKDRGGDEETKAAKQTLRDNLSSLNDYHLDDHNTNMVRILFVEEAAALSLHDASRKL